MATPKLKAQAGKLNMVIEQGTTFNPVLTYQDADANLINLTGYTARMKIKNARTDAGHLEELTTENGGITLGGVAGTIALLFTDTQTTAMTWETGVYDLELISGSGIVTRLLQGVVTVSAEVTT